MACTPGAEGTDSDTDRSYPPTDTAAVGHSGDTGRPEQTGDTGAPDFACDTGNVPDARASPDRTWTDTDREDGAGQDLWVGDLDGDGRDEILIGASNGVYGTAAVQSAAYIVSALPSSGALPDVASTTIAGWRSYDDFGSTVVGLAAAQLVGVGLSASSSEEVGMYFYDPRTADQSGPDAVGGLHTPTLYGFSDAADCDGVGGRPMLCVSAIESGGVSRTFLYEGPFDRTIEQGDARTVISGNIGDQAILLRSGRDLDNDGWNDLIVGADLAGDGGRIGIVSDPSAGEMTLWDVALASFEEAAPVGYLGIGLDAADLDGDGHVDLFGGAIGVGSGTAYVFLGPFSGEYAVDDAAVTVEGTDCHVWTGYSGVLSDLDGDAVTDLAVAQAQVYMTGGPGRVLVYRGPLAGHYTQSEADVWLESPRPSTDTDWFGYRMQAGDLDGDDRGDLVVSAPNDDAAAPQAGAVHVLLGSSL